MTDDTTDGTDADFAPSPSNPTRGSLGPYTFDYDAEDDTLVVRDGEGAEWPFPDAGLVRDYPEESEVAFTEDFCRAVLGHAYRVTNMAATTRMRKRRECQLCGKQQVERPSTWRDADE